MSTKTTRVMNTNVPLANHQFVIITYWFSDARIDFALDSAKHVRWWGGGDVAFY